MGKFIDLSVDGKSMRTYFTTPSQNEKPKQGLILLQEAFGVNSHIQDLANRFTNEGYYVLAPEVFHRTAPAGFTCGYTEFNLASPHFSAINSKTLMADSKACFDYLKNEVKADDVSCVGYCLGGRAAYIVNTELQLKAAVAYYGGRMSDYLALAPQQKAPLLLLWGGLDEHIPTEQRRSIADALTKAKRSYVEVEFSWAQHGFSCNERASYNEKAAKQAWVLTLQFLKMP